jgi:predicted TPR repeat methyltransferase
LQPDEDPLAHTDALIADGNAGEAARYLQHLISKGRGGLLLRAKHVEALVAAGRIDTALVGARENATLYPGVAFAAVSLGEALLAAGHLPTAISEFQRALRIDPDFIAARISLGRAWLAAGEAEKALEAFAAIEGHNETVAQYVTEAEAMRTRPRSDPGYVRHLFDQFSADYDERMIGQLGYGAPQILRGLADLVMPDRTRKYSIFDLGCGTGLAGLAFKDIASRLDGVDLSPAMIEKARSRPLYDDLYVADLVTALGDSKRTYDLLLAADTLVYLGELSGVFTGARKGLAKDGTFLFTVEKKNGSGFELSPKRRWRHSESYLREESEKAGFEIAGLLDCHPRSEAGVPVEGFAIALR